MDTQTTYLPSKEDFEELLKHCKHAWDAKRKGRVFTGPNGESIFLPAVGYKFSGTYWSSSISGEQFAVYLYFGSDEVLADNSYRSDELSVRLVEEPLLTKEELALISRAATDIATGNYLLRPRSKEELSMLTEVGEALDTPDEGRTDRQKAIVYEYNMTSDYDFYMRSGFVDLGLPSGKRWASQNEQGFYTFDEAVKKFGTKSHKESNQKSTDMATTENDNKAQSALEGTERWVNHERRVEEINRYNWKDFSLAIDPYFIFGLKKGEDGKYRFVRNDDSKEHCLRRLSDLLNHRPVFVASIQSPLEGANAPLGSASVLFGYNSYDIHWASINNADGTKRNLKFDREVGPDEIICIDWQTSVRKWIGDPEHFEENLRKRNPAANPEKNVCLTTKDAFEQFRATGYCGVNFPFTEYKDGKPVLDSEGKPVVKNEPTLVQLDRGHCQRDGYPYVWLRTLRRMKAESRQFDKEGKAVQGQYRVFAAPAKGQSGVYLISEESMKDIVSGKGIDIKAIDAEGKDISVHCQMDVTTGVLRPGADWSLMKIQSAGRQVVNRDRLNGTVHTPAGESETMSAQGAKVSV